MGTQPLHRVAPADHPSRGDQHVDGLRAHHGGHKLGEFGSIALALGPVATLAFLETVAIAGRALLQVPAAEDDARAGEAGLGEHTRRATGQRARNQAEIEGVVLDARVRGVGHEPAGGAHCIARAHVEVGGHGGYHDRAELSGKGSPTTALTAMTERCE